MVLGHGRSWGRDAARVTWHTCAESRKHRTSVDPRGTKRSRWGPVGVPQESRRSPAGHPVTAQSQLSPGSPGSVTVRVIPTPQECDDDPASGAHSGNGITVHTTCTLTHTDARALTQTHVDFVNHASDNLETRHATAFFINPSFSTWHGSRHGLVVTRQEIRMDTPRWFISDTDATSTLLSSHSEKPSRGALLHSVTTYLAMRLLPRDAGLPYHRP